jgi:hypothetical protein
MKMRGMSSLKTTVFYHSYFNNTVILRHFSFESIFCITLLFNSAVSIVCSADQFPGYPWTQFCTGYIEVHFVVKEIKFY